MSSLARAALVTLAAISRGALAHEGRERGKHNESFDFVIVGGGLAGSVLANRLSASGEHSVLLMNIAGAPPQAYSGPVVLSDEFITNLNMTYSPGMRADIRQPGYRPVPEFSTSQTGSSPARWLGGSSLVGLSLYLRDHPEAINTWGEGWSWEELAPYFRRAERLEGPSFTIGESDYGTEGPYHIQEFPAYVHPLTWDFVRASKASGLPYVADLNTQLTDRAEAVGITPVSQRRDGTKTHAYDAYLKPAMGRRNLVVRDGVRADRLLIEDGHCRGVAYKRLSDGTDHRVVASKEVVVASGYVYSPRLLFLSGLGDEGELREEGVPVTGHLPAVGKHLTAARYSPMSWETAEPTLSQMAGAPISEPGCEAVPEAYGSAVSEATARFRSAAASLRDPASRRPDVVISFQPLFYKPEVAPLQYSMQYEAWPLRTNAYSLLVTLGETKAQGSLKLSGHPDTSPIVTHEPLTHPEDLERAAEAVRMARAIGGSTEFREQSHIENGAGAPDMWSAVYDGRGTCRMGKDSRDSVVDRHLRVHGVTGLRVADGSVIPRGSPYLSGPAVLAVAERAADLVLQAHGQQEPRGGESLLLDTAAAEEPQPRCSIDRLATALGPKFPLMAAVQYLAEPSLATRAAAAAALRPSGPAPALLLAAGGLLAGGLLAAAGALAAFAKRSARQAAGADGYLALSA